MKTWFIGTLMAAVGAIAFGISDSIGPITYEWGSNLLTLLFLNQLLALPCIWILMKCQGISLRCSNRAGLWSALLVGAFGLAGTALTLNMSFILVGVGVGIMLHMTHTVFTAVAEAILQKTRLKPINCMAIVFVLVGTTCMAIDKPGGNYSVTGILISVLSGAFYAFQLLGLAHTPASNEPPLRTLFYMLLSAALVFGAVAVGSGQLMLHTMSPPAVAINCACALLTNVVGFSLIQLGIQKVDASWVAVLGALESVTGTILGCVLFRETLSPLKALGCILIILAVTIPSTTSLFKSRKA